MKNKYRNIFLAFGIIAVLIMIFTFDMDYRELWVNLKRAGIYLPLVLLLWLFVYLINTLSWYIIIRSGGKPGFSFSRLYKFTVTGFALNYVTPVGLMGGEPYRIMELKPFIGIERATSSVILYVMMHIFSHFWFWFLSVFLYIALYPVGVSMGIMLGVIAAFCMLAIYFFVRGYKTGMAQKGIRLLTHIPFVKNWARRFEQEKQDTLEQIDSQIALLHGQHKRTFYASLSFEVMARVLQSLEIYLILKAFAADISIADSILILAFSSLFSNLIFFSPMQLGAREGGLALAVDGLHLTGALGVYTGLITRIRELVWIAIGILLIKVGNKDLKQIQAEYEEEQKRKQKTN